MKLTLPQQDIYFEQLLCPNEPIYNIGAKIEINGQVNIDVFKKAYTALIDQHDAYRSIVVKNDENITFKLLDDHFSELGFIDFSSVEDPMSKATNYMQEEFTKPFELLKGNLLHVFTLIKVKEDFYYLFSVYHHIITDGWGTSLMFQRLVQNYNEIFHFGEIKTIYPFSYKSFMEEDQEYENSKSFLQDKEYWLQKFKDLPENLLNKIDDSVQINKSSRKELIVKREVYNQMIRLAEEYKCSTFHVILGILYTYFGRKHQNNDFAIGLPVLNRSKSIYKKTVGLFMGVSPLRMSLNFDDNFENLIHDIKNKLKQDYRYQRFPLGKLIQGLQLFHEKERLFNITLSYEKQNYATNFQDTHTKVIPLSHQAERVALAIYIREFNESDDVKIDFDYNLNYFEEARITEVVHHFENLIHAILATPNKKLKDLIYLSEEEEHRILVQFNKSKIAYPKEKTVVSLFQDQVSKTPGKEALKDDYKSYSYLELDKLSSQIAEQLIAVYGKKDKSPIAVLLGRSANLIIVLLGILKAGRSYIPLDPTFPKDRLGYIIDNSKSKVLIRENSYELDELDEKVAILSLENLLEGINDFKGIISPTISAEDTAYIIYTSGSTGNPKGVEIGHKSLANFLTSMQQTPGIEVKDTLFSVTTYSFDISILEFFAPLISGAALYIANHQVLSDPVLIIKKLEEIQPTIIQATPSFYQMLFNAGWKGDKRLKIMCGGDLLSEALAEKLITNSFELWNMYGPTETTIWSSVKKVTQSKEASNIGKPINNTQFYILDEFLTPKPIGISGAIYIAGDGLAKGYYKNETLTNEKFIQNPFHQDSLLYETGDVGKWNDRGEIDFLGRNDNQVKIRGYRIELGDIESQLNQIFGVKESVLIAKKGMYQETFLVAYILSSHEEVDVESIKSALKITLPAYMIPNVIISLDEFPLTPNQKIDRKNLSQREILQQTRVNKFTEPKTDLEKKLAKYWQEVLNVKESISIHENFFALGGHSLNAVKLVGLINEDLLFNINMKTIFDYPTIELLAGYLQNQMHVQKTALKIATAKTKDLYELTPAQYNIWLASQQKNSSISYNMFAGYKIEGEIKLDKMTQAINEVIEHYEILRTNFTEINGVPYQKINHFTNSRFSIGLRDLKEKNTETIINEFISKEFNLESDLLIRVKLMELENNDFVLLFCTHHIIVDGLSLEIFIREMVENYNRFSDLEIVAKKNSVFQFKDYSEWLNKNNENDEVKKELFWRNYLKNYKPKEFFYKDFDLENNNKSGSQYTFELTQDTTLALKKIAIKEQVTFYTLLMTALNTLVYKFSNHTDIIMGTVNSGRDIPELQNQIGMFVETFIIRTHIEPDKNFKDALKSTQNNLLEVNNYSGVPFEKIPESDFDILFVYQNPEFSFDSNIKLNELRLSFYPIDNKYSRVPIVFNLFESDNKLKGNIEYNSDLFEKNTIQIIAQKYCTLLNEVIKNPLAIIDHLDARLESEKNTFFDFDFNF